MRTLPLSILLSVLLLAAPLARAHDTWFERLPGTPARLALTTGNLFPTGESPLAPESLAARGCRGAAGEAVALKPLRIDTHALLLEAAAASARLSCWAQSVPFEIELSPALVETYLREINPPEAVRAAWREQRRRGLPWRERYTKHARIELASPVAAPGDVAPAPLALDLVLESGPAPHAGESLRFRVLRDGQPLAGQAIELRGDASRIGLWRRTDAEGRASVQVPLAGRWVLRGTELRLDPADAGRWESRFITLAFDVAPAEIKPSAAAPAEVKHSAAAPAETEHSAAAPAEVKRTAAAPVQATGNN